MSRRISTAFNSLSLREWLASNFSLQYQSWNKHWGLENKENDHQLKKILLDRQVLLYHRERANDCMENMHTDSCSKRLPPACLVCLLRPWFSSTLVKQQTNEKKDQLGIISFDAENSKRIYGSPSTNISRLCRLIHFIHFYGARGHF